MFDPLDFLKFAEELKSSPNDEARLRTSISRAYYSAFLKAREWLKTKGCDFYNDGRDHKGTQVGLGHHKGKRLKDKMGDLRERRNEADYNLSKEVKEKDVEDAILIAKEIVKVCS